MRIRLVKKMMISLILLRIGKMESFSILKNRNSISILVD